MLGSGDLSGLLHSVETQSYVATASSLLPTHGLLAHCNLTQCWNEINNAVSSAGFLDQTASNVRYLARASGIESEHIFNLVQKQFTPRIVCNLFLEAPLATRF